MNRNKVLSKAAEECIKELYSLAQPYIEWNEFVKENKNYSNRYKAWKRYYELSKKESLTEEELKEFSVYPNAWKDKSITECIGPCPCEYYYLPKGVMKDIVEEYVHAYKIDNHKELLDTIHILKSYCKDPIVDKWIDDYDDKYGRYPGYRGYEHTNNLEEEITTLIKMYCSDSEADFNGVAKEVLGIFFEFLDMAGKFFNWNGELNAFNTEIYLGVSPNSDKQAVIDNWKIYRKTNIKIDDSKYDEYDEE